MISSGCSVVLVITDFHFLDMRQRCKDKLTRMCHYSKSHMIGVKIFKEIIILNREML